MLWSVLNWRVHVHAYVDGEAVKALKELRLTVDDFEVKGIIGRGHFGEVSFPLYGSTHA